MTRTRLDHMRGRWLDRQKGTRHGIPIQAPNGRAGSGVIGATSDDFLHVPVSDDVGSFVTTRLPGLCSAGRKHERPHGPETHLLRYVYEPYAAAPREVVPVPHRAGPRSQDIGASSDADPRRGPVCAGRPGGHLHGQVFEIGGPMVAEWSVEDTNYLEGFAGLFAYSQNPVPPTDVTWDNFAAVPEPAAGLLVALGAGAVSLRRQTRRGAGAR